ncbi:unnamed protein product [Fraxinus pennsylvanica]|uniref:O-methyltransferase C-terminal domain-containing protein n=1 Tax=Fraxinus pennsylvanica TaxID=56036 RepID=A0AAD2AJM7_9LAMI|nr:unnamed protein product [Fraxinus pennsylvanica]
MTLEELVDALPINKAKSLGVSRLMQILMNSAFFIKATISNNDPENMGYWFTSASRLLLKDEPLSVTPFLLALLDPALTEPWHHLSEWFENENPTPFATKHGKTFWEYAGQEPRLNNFFDEAMASDAKLVASVLISDCKHLFEGLNSIVDVGGGTGTAASEVGSSYNETLIVLESDIQYAMLLGGFGIVQGHGGGGWDRTPRHDGGGLFGDGGEWIKMKLDEGDE